MGEGNKAGGAGLGAGFEDWPDDDEDEDQFEVVEEQK